MKLQKTYQHQDGDHPYDSKYRNRSKEFLFSPKTAD